MARTIHLRQSTAAVPQPVMSGVSERPCSKRSLYQPPALPPGGTVPIALPAAVPPSLANLVRQCLSRDPAARPTVAEITAAIHEAPQPPTPSHPRRQDLAPPGDPAPSLKPTPALKPAPSQSVREIPKSVQRRRLGVLAAIAMLLIIVAGIWARGHLRPAQTAVTVPTSPPPASAPAVAAAKPTTPAPATTPAPCAVAIAPSRPHERWHKDQRACYIRIFPRCRDAPGI